MLTFKDYIKEVFHLTLQYHDTLNPKLWDGGKLKPTVRETLLSSAYDFAKYSGIDKSRIKDIVITGSNVNFNFNDVTSDLDVHLMSDETGLDELELFRKKVSYGKEHSDLKIFGIPVELYAQNSVEHFPKQQGVFSLLNDVWIMTPTHLDTDTLMSDPKVINKIKYYIHYIKKYLLPDGTEKEILAFKEKLWQMRTTGLGTEGEFSIGNMVYKDLRNRKLIDNLNSKLEILQAE